MKFTFSITLSFALLCLSNCGDSEPSKELNGLEIKCLNRTEDIMTKKSLIGSEIYEMTEFAVLTHSKDKTHIHLDKITLDCAATNPDIFRINYAVDVDTLKLYGVYKYNVEGRCGACTSSFDLTIESIVDDIKYLVYSERDGRGSIRIFPVKYQ
jgi:hypothetical protein